MSAVLDVEDVDEDHPVRRARRNPNASHLVTAWLRHELTLDELREALKFKEDE